MNALIRRRLFWAILGLGAVLRIVYLLWSREVPFFDYPITDALYHHRWATAIADGIWWDGKPFFRAPLYPYTLGLLYSLFGPSVWTGKIFGHLLGLWTGGMIMALALRLFDRRTAWVAGWLWLGSGLVMFYEGELLLDSFFTFLLCGTTLLFLTGPSSARRCALAGFCLGLAAITRPTMLASVPVFAWYVWRQKPRHPVRLGAASLAGMFIPVLTVCGLNSYALGRPMGIATQGGINFYIGNNPSANGYSAILPPPWGYAWNYPDLVRHAEQNAGRPLDDALVSDYYYGQGLRFIRSEPGAFLKLALRKALLSVNYLTISNNLNLPWLVRKIPLLEWLPVRVACLVPLALLGWLRSRPAPGAYHALWGIVVTYSALLVAFFTIERFRLPLVPIWIVLAAFGAGAWWDGRPRLKVLGLALAGCLVVFPNWYFIDVRNEGLAYFNLGNVALRKADNRAAEALFDTAQSWQPELQQLRLNRGLARLRQGKLDSARADFQAEAGQYPTDARAYNNLAALYLLQSDTARALGAIDSGLARDSSLALLYLQRIAIAADREDTLTFAGALGASRRHNKGLAVWSYWDAEYLSLTGRNVQARDRYHEFLEARRAWPTLDAAEYTVAGPPDPRVHYQIALTWLVEGELDSATAYFARAARADSTLFEAWSNWGTSALARGDAETALDLYRTALRFVPSSALLWTNVAHAHLALGRPDSARTALVRALVADSSFEPARVLREQLETLP